MCKMGPLARTESNTRASEEPNSGFYHQPPSKLHHALHSLSGWRAWGKHRLYHQPPFYLLFQMLGLRCAALIWSLLQTPQSLPPLSPSPPLPLGWTRMCRQQRPASHRKDSICTQAPPQLWTSGPSLWWSQLHPWFPTAPMRLLQSMRTESSPHMALYPHIMTQSTGIYQQIATNYRQPNALKRPGYKAPKEQRRKHPRIVPLQYAPSFWPMWGDFVGPGAWSHVICSGSLLSPQEIRGFVPLGHVSGRCQQPEEVPLGESPSSPRPPPENSIISRHQETQES